MNLTHSHKQKGVIHDYPETILYFSEKQQVHLAPFHHPLAFERHSSWLQIHCPIVFELVMNELHS